MCKQTIRFCPACGKESLKPYDTKAFKCNICNFLYYHNVAITSSAIIEVKNETLMVSRAHNPCKGMLDFPGGFVEKHETAELGLQRELKEELALELEDTGKYLCNFTNVYEYAGVEYNTLDMYFLITLNEKPNIVTADDVAAFEWLKPDLIDENKIGFDSVKNAVLFYKEHFE